MIDITFLGEPGTTFSSEAWPLLAQEFKIERFNSAKCIPAFLNGEILKMTTKHGGYGVIALESLSEGNIDQSIDSFVPLLKQYNSNGDCPIQIYGAIAHTLNICLMARPWIPKEELLGVIAHKAALKACRNKITGIIIEAANNGQAAKQVAKDGMYKYYAALGPWGAAAKYKLNLIEENFEDEKAVTTFALIGPKGTEIPEGDINQGFVVFSVRNTPGAMESVCELFSREGLNMSYIRSSHVTKGTYHFIISYTFPRSSIYLFNRATKLLHNRTKSHLTFGPFPVIQK